MPYIQLHQIASLSISEGLNEISRENGKRFVSVQANVRGTDLDHLLKMPRRKLTVKSPSRMAIGSPGEDNLKILSPQGTDYSGRSHLFRPDLFLLYTAFNSVKDALLVFTGVPLALTGGIISLWLRDMPFSISAAVGFIALSGIAVLNGLVLVTYIDQLRKEGKELREAIIQGALTRFRPVMMTALVASFGFIPMALSTSTGAEVQKPLATVVIGGLISSTLADPPHPPRTLSVIFRCSQIDPFFPKKSVERRKNNRIGRIAFLLIKENENLTHLTEKFFGTGS